jgi:predicted RND superfamily exporter protein
MATTVIEAFARLIVKRPVAWAIVVLTALLAAVSAGLSTQVEQDDDVLAFLPRTNPDIEAFYDINERFGATDVALVGIQTTDVFDRDFLTRLEALTLTLRDTQGLDHALTLFNVPDFVKDPVGGGIISSSLIEQVPETDEGMAALREKVMSRDHIIGTLISADGTAAQVVAFASPGVEHREVAGHLRAAVLQHFDEGQVYWGGAPFISTWIFETTQADMARLTPWAVVVIIVIMMAAFRDVLGTALGLVSTAIGIAVSRAVMAALDVSFNIVLSSMPVILFAVGSAYAIHMLSRYDAQARKLGPGPDAVAATLINTGPTVIAAGMTTVAGLGSFVMMDIAPLRTFGIFTALGIFVTLVLSLTFVPAVMALFPRPIRAGVGGPLRPLMIRSAVWVQEHRGVGAGVVGVIALVGLAFAGSVDTRMDLSAFFDEGSPPDQAQRFLDEKFGGSQFIQVLVEGELEQPEVLREIARISDELVRIPLVSDVQGVHTALEITSDAMTGARRVPDRAAQMGVLYRFLSSDPSVAKLVTEERDAALLQVKVGSNRADDLDAVLAQVKAVVDTQAIRRFSVAKTGAEGFDERIETLIVARVLALAHRYAVELPADTAEQTVDFLRGPRATVDASVLTAVLSTFLQSEESYVPLQPDQAQAVAAAVVTLGPEFDYEGLGQAARSGLLQALSAQALPDADPATLVVDEALVGDLQVVLDGPLRDYWREAQAEADGRALLQRLGVPAAATPTQERFAAGVASKLQDRESPTAMIADPAGDQTLAWKVNGMPVLYQGLSRSVTANQFRSLAFSLALVFGIMVVLFRSLTAGLLATAPTALTLALIYGGMGVMGVHLDIGTSMLASIIIGAGVDYAVHLMAAWEANGQETLADAAAHAVDETSHAIWTNAIMVAAGFFVLTLGDARPLKNVGGLTSAAMIVAALCTFLLVPMFARKRRYGSSY